MPPSNDDLANAQILTGSSVSVNGTTVDSTNEPEEITYGFNFGVGDVWYSWVAPSTGTIQLNMTATIMDGEIDINTGTDFSNMINVTFSVLSGGMATISMAVIEGNTYLIQVPYYAISGTFDLSLTYILPPLNDNYTQAQSITTVSFPISADNTLATNEIGEPTAHYNTLWYTFTSSSDGILTLLFDTSFSGASFDVYTNNILSELNPVDSLGATGNIFPILNNITYSIVVYSSDSSSYGEFILKASFASAPYPVNDNFSSAITLEGNTFSASGDNTLATNQLYEDTTNYFSVWYSYTPQVTSQLTLTRQVGIPLNFKVYNGTSIQNIVELVSGNNTVTLPLVGGVTYYISVSSQNSTTYGAFSFSGIGNAELVFSYIGPTSTSLVTNTNGLNSIVIDPNNRIYILKATFGAPIVLYSDNGGATWTTDRTFPTLPSSNTYAASIAMYFDENGNVVVMYLTFVNAFNNNSYILGASVRDKSTGIWSDYTATQVNSLSNIGTWAITWGFCQSDDGTIHFAQTYVRAAVNGSLAGGGSMNIIYCNFKDGSFSTVTPITEYSGNNSVGFYSIQLVNHNSEILIFWRLINGGGNDNGPLNYCPINPTSPLIMDAVTAAGTWASGQAYKVGDLVTHAGTIYKCLSNHTSGTFSVDLGNGDWVVLSSYATPTVVSALVNQDVYNVKSNGNLYFATGHGNGATLSALYENFVNIIPTVNTNDWGNWMTLDAFEIAMNDDMVVYGIDNRVFNGSPSVVARIGGLWQEEHTNNNNTFVGGHTYNFAVIR